MGYCSLEIRHHCGRHVQAEILLPVVLIRRGYDAWLLREDGITVDPDTYSLQVSNDPGYEGFCYLGMHQQRFSRVAHRRPVSLGVEDDPAGHVEIGGLVDIHVTIADPGLDHRHR